LLREIYRYFYGLIGRLTTNEVLGSTVELGFGIGNINEVLPDCLRTDIFPNPWIDQLENAYSLYFPSGSVANMILFDVFHHLRYPGDAFDEFYRVLVPGGRVIIFDPCLSLLGLLVYGVAHHEPVGMWDKIAWRSPKGWTYREDSYYAAQGNAYRIFWRSNIGAKLPGWRLLHRQRLSAISYICSGGYSKPQLYPGSLYGAMRCVDSLLDYLPLLLATRLLVGLEKEFYRRSGVTQEDITPQSLARNSSETSRQVNSTKIESRLTI
jgi:SAM-dependent methyltransferase